MKINVKYIATKDYPTWIIDVEKLEQRVWKWIPASVLDWDTQHDEYVYDGSIHWDDEFRGRHLDDLRIGGSYVGIDFGRDDGTAPF
jgi:hypothetical protein